MNTQLYLLVVLLSTVNGYIERDVPENKLIFDQEFFKSVLDSDVCEQQLNYMINNDTGLVARFLDAGIRTPRGILEGNLVDLGNYYQCLEIKEAAEETTIEGKYCTIRVPLNQELKWPGITLPENPWPELNPDDISPETLENLNVYQNVQRSALGAKDTEINTTDLSFLLAVCIPKTCSTKQFLQSLYVNVTNYGFQYQEEYCRLPNDKRWVPGDYVAIALFSFLGVLVAASTAYDVNQTFLKGADPKRLSKLFLSFSVVTNTRRLVTYTPVPGAIECIDGIRALAMVWVVVGHTYVNQLFLIANPLGILNWITSPQSIWITMGPITVDTFFMLSGLLLVFTTSGKLTGLKLLKNLHMFYLNRLLRMFPILAAFVLLHATLLIHMFDGPYLSHVGTLTQNCRMYWWATLLHVQNWVSPKQMCLAHTWYLAIDVQLYILSPVVLFFVLSKKKYVSWIALVGALLVTLATASTFNFMMDFQAGPVIPSRSDDPNEQIRYLSYYYVNTLTRAAPFFVGMIYGYILHLYKGRQIVISRIASTILWLCTITIIAVIAYSTYAVMQLDWDNQVVDNILNSYMRAVWAMAIGWIVLACVHGYGGPINWVLTMHCWKVLSRLSYAIYIVHYPLIFFVDATSLAPIYFSVNGSLFKFLADFGLATLVAYILTLLVDSPCSTLIKLVLGGGAPRRPPVKEEPTKHGEDNDGFEDTERDIKVRL